MYEAFYGLKERPFNLTPDPRYLYLSEKHTEAFAHLLYGVKNRSGFVMVSGEIGTGKTTILRTLLNRLEDDTEVAFIFNPYLEPIELLKKINEDFGIDSRAVTVKDLIDELNQYLLDRTAEGKNCVLVIDEAQDLKPEVLEQIRLLSNLETESQKLIQIVLIGQPELVNSLSLPELRQLNQRITARYHLKPLDRDETAHYIAYRLRIAGGKETLQFSPKALRVVYRLSAGTPRVINAICDRALLIGYTMESREMTPEIIRRAYQEIQGQKERAFVKRATGLMRYLPGPSFVWTSILIVIAGTFLVAPFAKEIGQRMDKVLAALRPAMETDDGRVLANADPENKERSSDVTFSAEEGDYSNFTFRELVDALDSQKTLNGAVVSILRQWNLAPVTDYPSAPTAEAAAEFAQANGLDAVIQSWTLEEVEKIGLPCIMKVSGEKQYLWMGVVGIDEKEVRITTSVTDSVDVSRDEFKKCYLGQTVIFFQDYQPEAGTLEQSMNGETVRILQSQLRACGLYNSLPTGVYGPDTALAVMQLQMLTGLPSDGRAGPLTRMVLSSWLPGFETPSLKPRSAFQRNTLGAGPMPPIAMGSPIDSIGRVYGGQGTGSIDLQERYRDSASGRQRSGDAGALLAQGESMRSTQLDENTIDDKAMIENPDQVKGQFRPGTETEKRVPLKGSEVILPQPRNTGAERESLAPRVTEEKTVTNPSTGGTPLIPSNADANKG